MQKIIVKIVEEDLGQVNGEAECFIVGTEVGKEFVKKFVAEASKLDKIVLADGDKATELCQETGLSGVIVDLSKTEDVEKEMKRVREVIGDKFLGVISRSRRHELMLVGENDPDFIALKVWEDGLDKAKELVEWYLEFFLIQLALIPQDGVDVGELPADIVIKST